MRTDFLLTVAEIAIALAGFAGLIVAISTRHDGRADEARLDLQLLKNVLGASFMAVGFALLPVVLLSMDVEARLAWRGSAGTLALALPLYMARTVPSALAGYRSLNRPVPLGYRMNFVLALVVIGALGLSVVDLISTSVYLPAVSYLVYAAAASFVRVFLSVARAAV